jgi:Mn2+/Fe2+ NRAMP family transporter
LFIWWLVVRGTAKSVERVFLLMSLVFFTYIISAFLAKPDWGQVATGFTRPNFSGDTVYLFTLVALIGTTVTPFMQVYVQSAVVEKRMDEDELHLARADVIVGTAFACLISAFIVICTAATLNANGVYDVDSAATAAESLVPIAGEYAKYLFAVGLLGAAMLAMGVLPLATAFSLSEALGFEKGISRSFREAPIFLGIFTSLLVIGGVVAMIPGIPQIPLLLVTQCVNGLLLPVILIAIVKLASNEDIMGEHRNTTVFNIVAWGIAAVVSSLSLLLIGKTIVGMF